MMFYRNEENIMTIISGFGDNIVSIVTTNPENKKANGIVLCQADKQHTIGEKIIPTTEPIMGPAVQIFFYSEKSIDVVIDALQELKKLYFYDERMTEKAKEELFEISRRDR